MSRAGAYMNLNGGQAGMDLTEMAVGDQIGVLGDPYPQRSFMDLQMQNEFGVGTTELFVSPKDMGPRSSMDIAMQTKFNPYFQLSGNCKGSKEPYCGGGGVPMSAAQKKPLNPVGIAKINANPYNPASGMVKYVPLS